MIEKSKPRRLVVISDFQGGGPFPADIPSIETLQQQWQSAARGTPASATDAIPDFQVEGGYIERLPLACVKAGMVDVIEIWAHWRSDDLPEADLSQAPLIIRRSFQMNGPDAPFHSNDMLAHIEIFGPPEMLCVWGLGVSEEILIACDKTYKIYNSIDAPALRIPPEVSRHFDLVLTGAEWQSDEVTALHPQMKTAILPIGPEFASDSMFYPIKGAKPYDIIYVAAAQGYKRHDILFDAMAKLPRSLRALCVFGYGEMGEDLRRQAQDLGIDVDFVGPPGVSFAEVNRLMNLAKMGVVCGVNDGAPAILTEYMLAGLPVLANNHLSCGLQYITAQTGQVASAEQFHEGIASMLEKLDKFSPRQTVIENWTWPHSIEKLRKIIDISEY